MTFEELVAQATELSIPQRKALINALIDSFTTEPAKLTKQRTPNLHTGQVWTSEDFNDELPDSFWLGEEIKPPLH